MKTIIQRAKQVMTLTFIISLGACRIAYCSTPGSELTSTEVYHKEAVKSGMQSAAIKIAEAVREEMNTISITRLALPGTLDLNIDTAGSDLFNSDLSTWEPDEDSMAFDNTTSREMDPQTHWKGPGRYKKYNGKYLA